MPTDQSPKLKCVLCNLQLDVVDVYNSLPHPADSNSITPAKLTRMLQCSNNVAFNL